MNHITSWDNYSDASDEEENIYHSYVINDTTKKLLLRKYVQYVKDALMEDEVNEIMSKCNYKDEEIKKMIDEKINSIFKERPGYFKSEWKSKDTNRKYQSKQIPGKDNMNVSNKLSNCNYSSIVSSTVYMNTSETDSSKMDRDVNFNRANHYKNGMSTNYNGTHNINNGKKVYSSQESYVTKSKDYYYEENFEHGRTQQDYYKKEEFADSEYPKNFRVEDGRTNNKSEISNKNYKIDIVFNDKKVEKEVISNSLDSPHAKNEKKNNSNFVISQNEITVKLSPEKSISPDRKIVSADELKNYEEELKKNKEIILQMKNLHNTKKLNDELKNEIKSDYDLKKIPTNVLNANTYSSYFYQTEVSRKSTKNTDNSSDLSQNTENANQKLPFQNNQRKMNVNMNMYQGGYYNPGMMMSAIPIFYPVQGMEPMIGYNPYFNGIYGTPPFAYPAPYMNQNSFYGGMGFPKPATSNTKKE